MSGNRNKAEATKRLTSMGLAPAYVQEEEAAALFSMSVGAFRKWQKVDPNAPQPEWLGGCKRYRVPGGWARSESPKLQPSSDQIMAAIDAAESSSVR